MNPDLIPFYFQEEELEQIAEAEGKRLEKVIYTIWRNIAKKEEIFEALDGISLFFEDGQRLDLLPREDQQGIEIRSLNFALEQTRVQQQFKGQVELKQVDMSLSPVWKDSLGQRLDSVGMNSPMDGYFQSNLIQLKFSGTQVEISMGQEGLIAYTI